MPIRDRPRRAVCRAVESEALYARLRASERGSWAVSMHCSWATDLASECVRLLSERTGLTDRVMSSERIKSKRIWVLISSTHTLIEILTSRVDQKNSIKMVVTYWEVNPSMLEVTYEFHFLFGLYIRVHSCVSTKSACEYQISLSSSVSQSPYKNESIIVLT